MPSGFPYKDQFLSQMRLVGDPAADSFILKSFGDSGLKGDLYEWLSSVRCNSDLDTLPAAYTEEELFRHVKSLPPWVDKKLLQQGSQFFARYQNLIMQLLGLLSLPYCYAAADGAMVLYLSQRLRNDIPKRLADTGEFVLNVQSPGAFEEKGMGFVSVLKTRLIHAIARYYTLASKKWDHCWGFPVNQEDLAGTSLAFSLIVVRGLRKTGIIISNEDQQAFLHLWAVISYLLGVDEKLIPLEGKAANQLESLIRKRQFKASEQGRELTRSLIESLTQISPSTIGSKEIKQLVCYLLGTDVSEMLGIGDVPTFHTGYRMRIFSALSTWNPYLISKKNI